MLNNLERIEEKQKEINKDVADIKINIENIDCTLKTFMKNNFCFTSFDLKN